MNGFSTRRPLLCWAFVLTTLVVVFPKTELNAKDAPGAKRDAVDHPFFLVSFASIDRLKTRAETLAHALGMPGDGPKFLSALVDGDEDIESLMNSPGLDPTRPVGAMSYPKWFGDLADKEDADFDNDSLIEDPLGFSLEHLVESFVENSTLVICLPVKDRQALLTSVKDILDDGASLSEVEGQPGWYAISGDDDVRLGFVGNYLYVVADNGEQKQFHRNYPEFDKLAKGSLGRNGFVFAVYRRGLPALIRDVVAPTFQLTYAARFQRQDEESDAEFRLRTLFGPQQRQLLDLLLSHIDEFRIGGHVDSRTRAIVVESEVVGPKGGKLAKFCGDAKLKANPFASLATADASLVAAASLPLPEKEWLPFADWLLQQATELGETGAAGVVRALARTVESGQLDVYTFNPTWREGLIAVRVAGTPQLPEQFQQMIQTAVDRPLFDMAADTVDGIPLHRSRTTFEASPIQLVMTILLRGVVDEQLDLPSFNDPVEATEREIQGLREVLKEDGTKELVAEVTKGIVPGAKDSMWLAVTPQGIWLGFARSATGDCPGWFKSQVAASLVKPTSANASRKKTAFQLLMRGLGAATRPDVQQVAGTDEPATSDDERSRGEILRDYPNAISVDLAPTDTGARFSVRFEEAYFQWFATYIMDSTKKNAAVPPVAPEPEGNAPPK